MVLNIQAATSERQKHYPRRDKDLTSHEGVLGPPGNMDLTSQEGVLGPPSCCQPNHSALITDRNQTDTM